MRFFKPNTKYSILFLILISLTSCEEFLDVPPPGTLIPQRVEDYETILNHGLQVRYDFVPGAFLGDGYTITSSIRSTNTLRQNSYQWSDFLFGLSGTDNYWADLYSNILNYNVIITEVLDAEGNPQDALRVKSEAHLARAVEYFLLINNYAKPFNSATASTDLGVPIEENIGLDEGFTRNTVQEVYNFIIQDLNLALENLEDESPFNNPFRGSNAGANGMLARVYMMMGDYDLMQEHANRAIEIAGNVSFDFNNLIGLNIVEFFEFFQNNILFPDDIFRRNTDRGGEVYATQELIDLYEVNDLRSSLFIGEQVNIGAGNERTAEPGFLFFENNYRLSAAVNGEDLHLMRAEANARLGNSQAAIDDLNLLRNLRFETGTYVDLTTADFPSQSDLLQFVIDERRREFTNTELRWFDLRRLAGSPNAKNTIERIVDGEVFSINLVTDNNITLAIPLEVLNFNPDMEQNPRDGVSPIN